MQCNVVFSGKFQLVFCLNLSKGKKKKKSPLNLAVPLCEIEKNYKNRFIEAYKIQEKQKRSEFLKKSFFLISLRF